MHATTIISTAAEEPGTGEFRSLAAGFLDSVARFPDRPALEAGGETLTYAQLHARASAIAALLERETPAGGAPHTAVFGYRTPTAFAAVLAALLRGHAYVPLNPKFPADRTRTMIDRSDVRAVVVDAASEEACAEMLAAHDQQVLVVYADREDVSDAQARLPQHRVVGTGALVPAPRHEPVLAGPDDTAYLMFTSGSTGQPKGVQVLHRNVRHFLDLMVERWSITEEDRISQTFDLTFDLSVSDMFVSWERGACLCCPRPEQVLKPRTFIQESELTVWYSVPSLGLLMKRLGMLKAGSYPSLRLSLFCGEALPLELAEAWSAAAPASVLENVYGPTEVTISTTAYRFDPRTTPAECEFGLVPIGDPHDGMEALVVDADLNPVEPGAEGELLLRGAQVTAGYWRDPEKTAVSFRVLPGRDGIYYRTGDRVRRPVGAAPLRYLGRVDHQVKISGYRVELGEVESVLRDVSGVGEIVAVGWPKTDAGYGGIVAFLRADELDVPSLRMALARKLPDYMIPRSFRTVAEMPLNANGKFDRNALVALLSS